MHSKPKRKSFTEFFLNLPDKEKIIYQIIQNMNLNFDKLFNVIAENNNPFLSMKVIENEVNSIMNETENKKLLTVISKHQKTQIEIAIYQYIAVTMTKIIFMRNQDMNEHILLNNICSCHSSEN